MTDFNFADLLVRFAYNFIAAFIITRYIYFHKEKRREFLFTFFVFNMVIFFVCSFLKSIIMDVGFAFGLFAIFSILRYRTETIPIREMTYQFLVITLGAVNGLANPGTWHPELVFLNTVMVVFIFILDSNIVLKEEYFQFVKYEKIELIKPARRDELMRDLRERTGLDIHRIKIEKINFLRDTADIRVFYKEAPGHKEAQTGAVKK
ncbi:MAG: DUF4956 domain-containing protein [bacterium]|nr:DUF4956 domain-containing protein [bacterium]